MFHISTTNSQALTNTQEATILEFPMLKLDKQPKTWSNELKPLQRWLFKTNAEMKLTRSDPAFMNNATCWFTIQLCQHDKKEQPPSDRLHNSWREGHSNIAISNDACYVSWIYIKHDCPRHSPTSDFMKENTKLTTRVQDIWSVQISAVMQ